MPKIVASLSVLFSDGRMSSTTMFSHGLALSIRDGLHFKSFCLPLDLNHRDELAANDGTFSRFVWSEAARTPGHQDNQDARTPGQLARTWSRC